MKSYFNSLGEAQEAIVDLGHMFLNIKTIDEFRKLVFDPSDLDEELSPKINAQSLMIVVCENSDFNETYLIDRVYDYLKRDKEGDKKYESAIVAYVNNFEIRNYINNPKQEKLQITDENELKEFEKELPTTCFVIVPSKDNIYIITDSPLTVLNQIYVDVYFDEVYKKINKIEDKFENK